MLELPDVTLCCVDAKNYALALRALLRCREHVKFKNTLFLTHALPAEFHVPKDVQVVDVGPITSHEDYSRIVLKGLYSHIHSTHVLVVQWDGYVVHPEMWTDEFLACDYLGAPWPDDKGGYTVGNGGFSLRSRKLLEALQDDSFPLVTNTEDVTICGHHRPRLEAEFGIEFGRPELAKVFSFEMDQRDAVVGTTTFGFHGIFNFFLVESQRDIASLAALLPDSVAKSEITDLLLKNLVAFRQYDAALALGSRILECRPDAEEIASIVVEARERVEHLRLASNRTPEALIARIMRKIRRQH